ncbi:MAG: hypothetical protein WAL61_09910 [Acidimicrobiales bacterium]
MTTQLENEVRQALATRANVLPGDAVERLRAGDYRPRARRAPAAAGVLVGAATAGTVIAVVVGGGAPAAYAGWSATPTSPAAPSPAASTSCLEQLSATHDGPGGAAVGSGAWQNVLTDVRGPFTVALFQDDGAYAACFTGSSFTDVNQISSDGAGGATSGSGSISVHSQTGSAPAGGAPGATGGSTSVSVGATSSGDLQNVVQTHLSTSTDGPYTLVDGRTAPGVTGVSLVEQDGQAVTTTVQDGWFVAWWPGSADATSAQVTTGSGTTSEQLVPQMKVGPGVCQTTPAAPSPAAGAPGTSSACRSGGSASANPGNTARSSGNSGNSGNSGSGNSGNSGKAGPG